MFKQNKYQLTGTFEQLHPRDLPIAYLPAQTGILPYLESLDDSLGPQDLLRLLAKNGQSFSPANSWTEYPEDIWPRIVIDGFCHANTMLYARTLLNAGKSVSDFQIITGLQALRRDLGATEEEKYAICSHSLLLYKGRVLDLSRIYHRHTYTPYEYFCIAYDPELAISKCSCLFDKNKSTKETIPLGALKDARRLRIP